MREIKFRGKRLDNGEWLYGSLLVSHFKDDKKERYFITQFSGNYTFEHEVDPATVGQFTGLKDNNGRDIWEGDIISDGRQFNVKWDSRDACWTGEMHNDLQQRLDLAFLITHKQTRIIGNIHEIRNYLKLNKP